MVRAFVQLNRVSVQFHSVTQSYLTLCDPMDCSTAGFPVHHQLPKLAQTHVNWVGDASQPHHLYRLLLLLPSIFPSIKLFSDESVPHIRWIKYWSFSFSISPSNEYSWLISFRIDWLDLLAVQGTQEYSPTPQFKRINSSVLSFLYSPTLIFIHVYWKVNQMLWQWDSGGKKKKKNNSALWFPMNSSKEHCNCSYGKENCVPKINNHYVYTTHHLQMRARWIKYALFQ